MVRRRVRHEDEVVRRVAVVAGDAQRHHALQKRLHSGPSGFARRPCFINDRYEHNTVRSHLKGEDPTAAQSHKAYAYCKLLTEMTGGLPESRMASSPELR